MSNVMVSLGPLLCITPQVFYRRSPVAATNIVPSLKPEYQVLWGERGRKKPKGEKAKGEKCLTNTLPKATSGREWVVQALFSSILDGVVTLDQVAHSRVKITQA